MRCIQADTTDSCTGTISHNGITYGLIRTSDNKCWLDRNLGATRVATYSTDSQAYGWYFQWGRNLDGHQIYPSLTTTTLSATANPGHGNFILNTASPSNWRTVNDTSLWQSATQVNNPCPGGFHVPTYLEWNAVIASTAENITNYTSAFNSALKLPIPGYRFPNDGVGNLGSAGSSGWYWTSSYSGINTSRYLILGSGANTVNTTSRAVGLSVRCIRDF